MNFTSVLLTGAASNWEYMTVISQATPTSSDDFKVAVSTEFITFDDVRRTRDKTRKLIQHSSVPKVLNEFCNLVLTILDMNDVGKLDKFCAGLKLQVRR